MVLESSNNLNNSGVSSKEAMDRFRLIFEQAPLGIFQIDARGAITECNDRFVEMMGSSREALIGLDMKDYVKNSGVMEALNAMLAGHEGRYEGEYSSITGHKTIYARLLLSPILNEAGKPNGGVGIAEDWTERVSIERSLKTYEERYKLLVQRAPMPIVVAQGERVCFANLAACEFLGIDMKESIDIPFERVIYKEDLHIVRDRHIRRMRGEKVPEVYRFRVVGADGRMRWTEISAVQIEWAGKPATLNFLLDIEDRHLAEESLRASEQKYRNLFENAIWGIFQSTPDGRYISVNPAFAQLNEFDSPEQMIREVTDIGKLYARPSDRDELKRVLEERGRIDNYEIELNLPTKGRRWLSVNAKAVRDSNGDILYYDGFAQDVTERKRAEAESRRRMAEIEKLNRFMIGREGRIIEVKREVNDLLLKMGKEPRYKV